MFNPYSVLSQTIVVPWLVGAVVGNAVVGIAVVGNAVVGNAEGAAVSVLTNSWLEVP